MTTTALQSLLGSVLLAGAVGASSAMAAHATVPDATESELHTAQCVAALEANTDDLAAQVKAGRSELQPLLLDRLMDGAAFIGESFLQGERDEKRAQALLKAALEDQKTLPKAVLLARQSKCAEEGAHLLANADVLSRAVVSHFAQRRMKKLLEG